jgi:CRISPR-associated protein Cas5d
MPLSKPFRLHVWGEFALFTRPEMKVERVSYEIMTPAAARGILEAILWRPEMRWNVERIDRLVPVAYLSSTRAPFGKIASSSSDSKLESLLDAVSDAGLEHAAITPIVRLAAIEIDARICPPG